jgi:hypothetical protein
VEQNLIDQLIATYRTLNLYVRPLPDAELRQQNSVGQSARDLIIGLRDGELRFSKALKDNRVDGVPLPDLETIFSQETTLVVGTESQDDTADVVLSQFGTAREANLSILRSLDQPDWDAADGGVSVRQTVQRLVENDHRVLGQLGLLEPATE